MTSLGFDTVLVNNRIYDEDGILQLFNTLSVYDVRNFIFLSNFDITVNSFSLESEKIKGFKAFLSKLAPRGIHTYVYYNTFFDKGLVHNKDFNRLYALKKKSSLFINMPLLSKAVYEELAADINYMMYRISFVLLQPNEKNTSLHTLLFLHSNRKFGARTDKHYRGIYGTCTYSRRRYHSLFTYAYFVCF